MTDLSRDLSRFDYPLIVPVVRVLDARFIEGTKNIEHLVEQQQCEGQEPAIEWMPIEQWRELVGCN